MQVSDRTMHELYRMLGNEMRDGRGVAIENYVVDGERIRKAADNWQADRRGRLDFDASLWENWNAR